MRVDNNTKIKENNQFWDVKRSGEHLLWLLGPKEDGSFKNLKVTEKDFNALKSVLAWINRQSSGIIENNPVMAKLYLMQLVGDIRENKTTVFNEFIFERLSNQLAKPLELFYLAFYEDLAANQLNRLTEDNFRDKEGNKVIMDYKRFKETFPLEYVVAKLNERMIIDLHRRS